MERIKCFLIEKTGTFKVTKRETPCECGKEGCGDFNDPLWRRIDTGEIVGVYDEFPPGAMWFAPWYEDHYKGLDGRCLVVMTPAGEWIIDSRASNCTMRNDNVHKCWSRSGEPPNVTAGKDGPTCAAGAGSILINRGPGRNYHGFLRNGYLESC